MMNLRSGDKLHLSLSTLADLVEEDLTRDSDGDVPRQETREIEVVALPDTAGSDGVTFEIRDKGASG